MQRVCIHVLCVCVCVCVRARARVLRVSDVYVQDGAGSAPRKASNLYLAPHIPSVRPGLLCMPQQQRKWSVL